MCFVLSPPLARIGRIPPSGAWQVRGLIKVGGCNIGSNTARHIVLRNLVITGGYAGRPFTDDSGNAAVYADNAACVFVDLGSDITIEDCELSDCANGIFISPGPDGDLNRNNVLRRTYVHGNGLVGSFLEHNAYTHGGGLLVEGCRFGTLRDGATGNK